MPCTVLSPSRRTSHKTRENATTSSPSYFGLAIDGPGSHAPSGVRMAKSGLSPSGAGLRPAAASPTTSLPFHTSPDFEAFRHQIESNTFSLNQASVPRISKLDNTNKKFSSFEKKTEPHTPKNASVPRVDRKAASAEPTEHSPLSRSINKRGLSTSDVPIVSSRDNRSAFSGSDSSRDTGSPPLRHEEKCPRLSLPNDDVHLPAAAFPARSETLPEKFEIDGPTMVSAQHVVNILDSKDEDTLILDLRVSTQYASSRIAGAFNLCVPTTLLKRSSYNVDKLADTVRDTSQRAKFENWRAAKYIIVYDGNSSQLHEAATCQNVLKKFSTEGWNGNSHIIRGGFFEFSRNFPQYLEHGNSSPKTSSPPNLTLNTDSGSLAPVVGGCPMPATESAANPFFGNIRQNMDLIGGVGQIQIRLPATVDINQLQNLPMWLKRASDKKDEGKLVSEKFLQIEKLEQKRMQEALSGNVEYETNHEKDCSRSIKIAGIEQGSKNRYNNIWPYEHSRVKLRDVASQGSDYVNANFIQTSISDKKYIATQGPIPATFADFWTMVWQQDIRVIVMLTAEVEDGQVKAHNYWNEKAYGHMRVSFVSEHDVLLESTGPQNQRQRPSLGKQRASYPSRSSSSIEQIPRQATTPGQPRLSHPPSGSRPEQPRVYVQKFMLSDECHPWDRPREVTQIRFPSWPDFGAPAHPKHLLGLVEQCNIIVDAASTSTKDKDGHRPVLVHCSAGCGRTGAFCTVDTVLDVLKQQNPLNESKSRSSQLISRIDSNIKESTSMEIGFDHFSPSASASGSKGTAGDKKHLLRRDDIDLIEKTVKELRLQRISMVQSLRQYVLCYETVLEWVSKRSNPQIA